MRIAQAAAGRVDLQLVSTGKARSVASIGVLSVLVMW